MNNDLLSYSRTAEWLRCRYRWGLHYERKVSPRADNRAPHLGSAVHVGMAAALRAHAVGLAESQIYLELNMAITAFTVEYLDSHTLFDEEVVAAEEICDTAISIATRAIKWLNLDDWETVVHDDIPLIDRQVVIPLKGWAGFQGYFDWVALHKPTGQIWLIDHKVRKQFQPVESEEVSLQMATYQRILRKMGINAVGSRTLQIRSSMPSTPTLNKNGAMSRSQITTDWPTYEKALIASGLNPDDYREEMQPKLVAPFQMWATAYRGPAEIEAVWQQTIVPASREMHYKRRYFPRNMGFMNCQGCWAKRICLEELRGSDIDWIIDAEFSREESKEVIATELEV